MSAYVSSNKPNIATIYSAYLSSQSATDQSTFQATHNSTIIAPKCTTYIETIDATE